MTKPDLKTPRGSLDARLHSHLEAEMKPAASTRSKPRMVTGVRAFAHLYDLFLVDQWGVLHDGQTAYPGVTECLQELLALGKRVVILSNSGKRAANNARRLEAMGIPGDCYTSLITSGEVAREKLVARAYPFTPSLGRRCFVLGQGAESSLAVGLDVECVPTVVGADFILLAGVVDDQPFDFYQHVLDYAQKHDIPLICVNPDLVRLSPEGLVFSAGAVARRYEQIGGRVHYIGKPHPVMYEYCASVVPEFASSRIVAIGDSYYHDIGGGARFGLATVFVTHGIHHAAFAAKSDEASWFRKVADIAQDHRVLPEWVIRRFRW